MGHLLCVACVDVVACGGCGGMGVCGVCGVWDVCGVHVVVRCAYVVVYMLCMGCHILNVMILTRLLFNKININIFSLDW